MKIIHQMDLSGKESSAEATPAQTVLLQHQGHQYPGAGASPETQRSCSLSSASRKRSHKTEEGCSRPCGDLFASSRRSADLHRMNANARDGACPVNHFPVYYARRIGDPMPLTPILALGCPLSPVLTRAMLASAVSVSAIYQEPMDLLCLSVPTSPLVQDFAGLRLL